MKTAPGASSPLRLFGFVLVQSARHLLADNGFDRAAAIAFYTLLSICPLLLGVISLAGWFVEPDRAVREATRFLGAFVPEGHGLLRERLPGWYSSAAGQVSCRSPGCCGPGARCSAS